MKRNHLKSIVIGLACLTIPVACATPSDGTAGLTEGLTHAARVDPEEMIRNAHALVDEQKYVQAQDSFARILKVVPENEDAQAGLAYAARLSGNPGEALKHYQQLEMYPSRQTEALEGQGLALTRLRRWTDAERVLLSALELNKNSWRIWNALGQVRDHQQMWSEAEIAYSNAIALRPLAASLYNNLGMSYLCQLRFEEAIEQFDRSLFLKSGVPVVEGNRVIALAMKGDYEAAIGSIPLSERQYGLNNLGFVAMLNGDSSKARLFLQMAEGESTRYYQKAAENLKMLN